MKQRHTKLKSVALAALTTMGLALGAQAATAVQYTEPVYKGTDGSPTNGIDRWETKSVSAYTAVASSASAVTWGESGVTNWYVVKDADVQIDGGVTCQGHVNLILCAGAKLVVTNVVTYGKAGIATDESGSFTVYGQPDGAGELSVTGGGSGAGIGGSKDGDGSNITINGGTVTATGGNYGAGIGGGSYGVGLCITINGGTVTAAGGLFGAGIGGGADGAGSHISVNGGTVIATSGGSGAGIGGGSGEAGSGITINGGTVTAAGGSFGAGIGGGADGAGSHISVNGGTVTATGGDQAAGIGGGNWGDGSSITINGGMVTALCLDECGASIGGGGRGNGRDVVINGGVVSAIGAPRGAGIGGGLLGIGDNIALNGGVICVASPRRYDEDDRGWNDGELIGSGYGAASSTGVVISASARVLFNVTGEYYEHELIDPVVESPTDFNGLVILTPKELTFDRVLASGIAGLTTATIMTLTNAVTAETAAVAVGGEKVSYSDAFCRLGYEDDILTLMRIEAVLTIEQQPNATNGYEIAATTDGADGITNYAWYHAVAGEPVGFDTLTNRMVSGAGEYGEISGKNIKSIKNVLEESMNGLLLMWQTSDLPAGGAFRFNCSAPLLDLYNVLDELFGGTIGQDFAGKLKAVGENEWTYTPNDVYGMYVVLPLTCMDESVTEFWIENLRYEFMSHEMVDEGATMTAMPVAQGVAGDTYFCRVTYGHNGIPYTKDSEEFIFVPVASVPILAQPTAVDNTTLAVYTNGVLSAETAPDSGRWYVWSNETAVVVYTAANGYFFEGGATAVTNALDTSVNPAAMVGEAPDAPQLPPSITDVTARQRYPWNGKVDIAYTASNLVANAEVRGGAATLKVMAIDGTTTNVADAACLSGDVSAADGAHAFVWDMNAQGLTETVSTNVAFVVTCELVATGGVQLWEGGPYFATCNVGATEPQEPGYYFMWGDTNGYVRNAQSSEWVSVKDGTSFSFEGGSCPPMNKYNSALRQAGYIDADGNLVAQYDAATAHLGASWRIPTDAEWGMLIDNCTTVWTNNWNGTGVNGGVVTGKGGYSSKSIFLPAAGFGYQTEFNDFGTNEYYWSSTPDPSYSAAAWDFRIQSKYVQQGCAFRYCGQPVRPVRESAPGEAGTLCSAWAEGVRLDLRTGVRTATVGTTETLTYSTAWDGGNTATIAANDAPLYAGLEGSGTVDWTPTVLGTNTLTHTVVTGGVDVVQKAQFFVPYSEILEPEPAVEHTTFEVHTNGVALAKTDERYLVPSNAADVVAVYVADEGYYFADGSTAVTNALDTSVNPAAMVGEAPAAPQPFTRFAETTYATVEGLGVEVEVLGGAMERAVQATLSFVRGTGGYTKAYVGDKRVSFPLTLSWAKGEIGAKTVRFETAASAQAEADKAFTLQLGSPVGADIYADAAVCTVTIMDAQGGAAAKGYVRALVYPAGAGTVSGQGSLSSDRSYRTLTATSKAWSTFEGWYRAKADNPEMIDLDAPVEPYSVCSSRKIRVGYGTPNAAGTYFAYFTDVPAVASFDEPAAFDAQGRRLPGVAGITAQDPASGVYRTMVGVKVALPVNLVAEEGSDGKLSAKSLPNGLSLKKDKTTGTYEVVGIPTKAGSYDSVFTASNVAGKFSVTYRFEVDALPADAVGTFCGVVSDDKARAGVGSVTFTAGSAGKLSAKVMRRLTGTRSFTGNGYTYVDAETLSVAMTNSYGEVFEAALALNGGRLAGTAFGGDGRKGTLAANGETNGWFSAVRNAFEDAGEPQAILAAYRGTYAETLYADAEATEAVGTVQYRVSAKGSVQVSVKLDAAEEETASGLKKVPARTFSGMVPGAFRYDAEAGLGRVVLALRYGTYLWSSDVLLDGEARTAGGRARYVRPSADRTVSEPVDADQFMGVGWDD